MWDDRMTQVLTNLLKEDLSTSVHLRLTVNQSKSEYIAREKSFPMTFSQDYIHTRDGERFFDEKSHWPSGRWFHRAGYCDGVKCATILFDVDNPDTQSFVQIDNTFLDDMKFNIMSVPFPAQAFYVGSAPLAEALPTAEPMADGEVIRRTCDVFYFKQVGRADRKEQVVYHLDKETSVPLKVACYTSPDLLRIDRPLWMWEATSLDAVSGHHLPLTSRWTRFIVRDADKNKPPKINMTRDIHVDDVRFDEEVPKSVFWPVLQNGALVTDRFKDRSFVWSSAAPPPKAGVSVSDPIRAQEPDGPTWYVVSGSLLVVALLLGGIAYRSRG